MDSIFYFVPAVFALVALRAIYQHDRQAFDLVAELEQKPEEVSALPVDKLRRLVLLEARAKPRLKSTEGLWRSSTRTRPGSMTEYIRQRGLLPENEILAIQQIPAELVSHQQAYAAGSSKLELGEFLEQRFPTLYQIAPAKKEVAA